jgi:hypothetical protein
MHEPTCPPALLPRPWYWVQPVALTLLLHLALLAAYLQAFGGDISALVCADQKRVGHWPFEAVRVGFATGGFDGQFYYVLARNPWQRHQAFVDLPAYRHSRILFVALAWLLSGGDAERLLWALPALNLTCIAGLAWLGAFWAVRHGRNALWGCLLPIVVNAGAPALRDLTDPLSTLAVAGLLVAWLLRQNPWVVTAWAVAAVLSREQNAAVAGIVLLGALWQRRWPLAAGPAAALTVWVGWLLVLRAAYGNFPFLASNTSPPFAGIIYRLVHLRGAVGAHALPIHACAIAFLFLQMSLAVTMACYRPSRTLVLVALAGVALAVLAGVPIYMNGQSYTRVFLWMPLAVWLWGVQTGRAWPVWLLSPALLWPLFALVQVWRPGA